MGRTLYAYVGNDPFNKLDPTGKVAVVDDAVVVVSAAAVVAVCYFLCKDITDAVINGAVNLWNAATSSDDDAEEEETATEEKKGASKPEVGTCQAPGCGGETTNKPGKIADKLGVPVKEVKDAIHEVKKPLEGNPDVEVCTTCGEAYPQTDSGGLGDSVGNINDHLKPPNY